MKDNKNFVAARAWISKATVLALLASLLGACNDQASENPDVVVVSPSTQPSPAQTVVVSPTPQPNQTVVVSPSPQTSPTTTTTTTTTVVQEPITDVVVISSAPEPASLVGKRVKFTDTQVLSVIGDRPFWVGRSNNEQLAVVLDPALDKGSAEKKIVVKAGQTLDLTGVLKAMPPQETVQKQWGLSATEAQTLQSQAVYLQADKITNK
jgi:hypothetical protein